MEASERERPRGGRWALATLLSVSVVAAYLMLPSGEESDDSHERADEAVDEPGLLEIRSIAPLEPYPGSSLVIGYAGRADVEQLAVYAGKSELTVIARRAGTLVAQLPRTLEPGDLKVRLASREEGRPFSQRGLRSKPFHVRVKVASLRKVLRCLLGGVAFVILGIRLMARGVRGSTGLGAARALTRTSARPLVSYGFGVVLGALTQSTTGAAGLLAALACSSIVTSSAAALSFVGAQLGSTLAPLLATGLVEPREGLLAVAAGLLWLALARDRRGHALGRLLLGAGFVAVGLTTLRPALEPFVSEPVLLSVADRLHVDGPLDVALCALLGTALTALLQGPAPLVVLLLGVAQTTGRFSLATALALLAGTGLGAALAALVAVSSEPASRRLARLSLVYGALSTLLAAVGSGLWARVAERLLGSAAALSLFERRVPLSALGVQLALGFALSQLASALALGLVSGPLSRRLEARVRSSTSNHKLPDKDEGELALALGRVIALQEEALAATRELERAGDRRFGQRAEHVLGRARALLEVSLRDRRVRRDDTAREACSLLGAAFVSHQLQHALEILLERSERAIEARLGDDACERGAEDPLLADLHALVGEGLAAAALSLRAHTPPDLDDARAREIRINRLEAHARALLERDPAADPQPLHVLQVADAYEAVGNQVYRLAEALGAGFGALTNLQVS